MRKTRTKKNGKPKTLAKIRRKLYSKRKGRGIGASRISIRRTPVSARAVSVETALAEAMRAENMAWDALRDAKETAAVDAAWDAMKMAWDAMRDAKEATAEEEEARAEAERVVALMRARVAAVVAVDLAHAAATRARWLTATARVAAARAKAERGGRQWAERVLPREDEAKYEEVMAMAAETVAAVKAATARETAEKAVAEWKNLSKTFPR